jgi:hypothetical protein
MMVWQHLKRDWQMAKGLRMADGALQAKIGAFRLRNEYTFRFLDETWGGKD